MVVRKGWNPLEPMRGNRSLPIKSSVTITSGQVIVPEWNGTTLQWEWNIADYSNSAHKTQVAHFAMQDSTFKDVVAAGKLTGVASTGQFEIQTGFYVASDVANFTGGTPVTCGSSGDAGNVKSTTWGSGSPVIGIFTPDHHAGVIDLTGLKSEATDLTVVRFDTHWDQQNATAN